MNALGALHLISVSWARNFFAFNGRIFDKIPFLGIVLTDFGAFSGNFIKVIYCYRLLLIFASLQCIIFFVTKILASTPKRG